jgi:hypothetical protein
VSDGGATLVAASIFNLDGERWRMGDVDRCTYAKTSTTAWAHGQDDGAGHVGEIARGGGMQIDCLR